MAEYYRFADIAKKLDHSLLEVDQWAKLDFAPEAMKHQNIENYEKLEVARYLWLAQVTNFFEQAVAIERGSAKGMLSQFIQ